MYELTLTPGQLDLATLRRIHQEPVKLRLDPGCHDAIAKSVASVQQVLAEDRVVYGINTGFGMLANTRISSDDLELLQRSIVLSHAAGVGQFMQPSTVRLMMVLKINALARGYSG
ncbi:aromatic amino acid lyase, partial [Neptunomonas sp.]|uniref:aromatic amino acid lyase n=1 Tax=Neptunomonas sp. TaxID=1971898 RepID=UPI0035685F7A